jgi:hypothetical protein
LRNKTSTRIEITESGKIEIERLCFDVLKSLDDILKHIQHSDLKSISRIVVTSLPRKKRRVNRSIFGSYFKKQRRTDAFIEIYIANIFKHINSSKSFNMMLPIQEYGLACTVYHEIGHHIRLIRTHGVKSAKSEDFANKQQRYFLRKYLCEQAPKIEECFNQLESVGADQGMSIEIIKNMRAGWNNEYKSLIEGTSEVASDC